MGLKMDWDRIPLLALMMSASSFTAIYAVGVEAQEVRAVAQSQLAQRLAQHTASQQSRPSSRKRPEPVRISGSWFATQRGAGSRLSCANYELMEIVDPRAVSEPKVSSDFTGFAVRVPYSAAELRNLEFILQTENYEELQRVPLVLRPASETLLVNLPMDMLNNRSDSAYRWFVEATIVCQSEADQPLVVIEDAPEASSTVSATENVDTRKSSVGGWIEREPEPADSQSSSD